MRLKQTYSSREVASLTGLSARQLQLWAAGELVSPSIPSQPTAAGGRTERRYTPIELFELLTLADLRRRGFTIHQLHRVVDALRQQFGTRLFAATGGGGPVQLLTDGVAIFARTAAGELYDLLDEPAQPLLAIGSQGALKELRGKISRRNPKEKGRRVRRSRAAEKQSSI